MKIQIYSSEEINKNWEYNNNQTTVGSPLKTYKGSRISRSTKYGVGKLMGDDLYFHKQYADEIIPEDILTKAIQCLVECYPTFQYNCIKYNTKQHRIAFQEVPDFDSAREPVVGDWVAIQPLEDGTFKIQSGHSNYIFHHKYLWVKNDYAGFDVRESWEWSKTWLNRLKETSDGNGINRWNAQLEKYGLPIDTNAQ